MRKCAIFAVSSSCREYSCSFQVCVAPRKGVFVWLHFCDELSGFVWCAGLIPIVRDELTLSVKESVGNSFLGKCNSKGNEGKNIVQEAK